MTREEALADLRRLSAGLEADLAGQRRLLERIAAHEEGEALRSALLEIGAAAVLDDQP